MFYQCYTLLLLTPTTLHYRPTGPLAHLPSGLLPSPTTAHAHFAFRTPLPRREQCRLGTPVPRKRPRYSTPERHDKPALPFSSPTSTRLLTEHTPLSLAPACIVFVYLPYSKTRCMYTAVREAIQITSTSTSTSTSSLHPPSPSRAPRHARNNATKYTLRSKPMSSPRPTPESAKPIVHHRAQRPYIAIRPSSSLKPKVKVSANEPGDPRNQG